MKVVNAEWIPTTVLQFLDNCSSKELTVQIVLKETSNGNLWRPERVTFVRKAYHRSNYIAKMLTNFVSPGKATHNGKLTSCTNSSLRSDPRSKYDCRNRNFGCKYADFPRDLSKHESNCMLYRCPLENCKSSGVSVKEDLLKHCRKKHSIQISMRKTLFAGGNFFDLPIHKKVFIVVFVLLLIGFFWSFRK